MSNIDENEQTTAEITAVPTADGSAGDGQTGEVSSPTANIKCWACGGDHFRKACSHSKHKCSQCGRRGHLESYCRQTDGAPQNNGEVRQLKNKLEMAKGEAQYSAKVKAQIQAIKVIVDQILEDGQSSKSKKKKAAKANKKSSADSHGEGDGDDADAKDSSETRNATPAFSSRPRVPIMINEHRVMGVLGTAASVDCIGAKTAKELGIVKNETSKQVRVMGIGKPQSAFVSEALSVGLESGPTTTVALHVVPGNSPLIVSISTITEWGCVIDFGRDEVHIGDKTWKFEYTDSSGPPNVGLVDVVQEDAAS